MIDQPQDTGVPAFKDRKLGLVFFGVIQIALGALFALLVLFGLVAAMAFTPTGETAAAPAGPAVLSNLAIFAPLAVAYVWLGIGSILARRWARALSLITAWLWLIAGTVGFVAVIVFMPAVFSAMLREMAADPAVDEAQVRVFATVMRAFVIAMGLFFGVITPGVFVLFFRSKHVKATCEHRDPTVRWTDKCPLQVLAVSLLLAIGAYTTVLNGPATGWVFPVFGILLRGVPGAAVLLALAALMVYVAWGLYHLEVRAWWGAVALTIFGWVSWIVTLAGTTPVDMYDAMNVPAEQLETMRQFMPESWPWLLPVFSGAAWLGYLWYARRYFESPASDG